ncbi:MAG: tetratricopeptide repeat protein [Gemmatimonadaceae bacterium]|nr:tetratricopeptide repeat protein [Gemmatimonadaceae bacterium]
MSPAAGTTAGVAAGATAGRDLDVLRGMVARVDPRDPGAFNNLGVLYHTRGLHAEAVDAFLRALTLDPRMRTAARNLEVAARQPGACDERLRHVQDEVAADPDNRQAQRDQAQLLRLIGRTSDATRLLDALIAEDPDDAAALFERGLIEQRAGDLRRAQRWFERAVNAHAAGDARLHLAEVLYQRGQNEQALETLEQLLEESPRQAEAHLLRGFVLGDMGRHEAALLAARHASELNPRLDTVQGDLLLDPAPSTPIMQVEGDGALARHGLGLAFRQRGYFREARQEFERALAQGEDPHLVQHALAELDLLDGESRQAQARYEELLARQETARSWNEHGVAMHQRGEVAAAADSYRRALRIDPRHALAYNNLGVALADRRDAQAAREALLRAAELDPTLVLARLNLARWALEYGDPSEALALLREVVAFHPRDADAWHALGVVLARVERWDEARQALVHAVEHRPTHAEARYVLADALSRLGDDEGAARETEAALRLASIRRAPRLAVGIDLQRECPDAVGPVDLLALVGGAPLAGVTLAEQGVDALLPEQPRRELHKSPVARAIDWCEVADGFAERTLHGEAVERYRAARELLEPLVADETSAADPQVRQAMRQAWQRATRGEARTLCLLDYAAQALPLLMPLLEQASSDPELLTLLAAARLSEANIDMVDAPNADSLTAARAALLRVLGQECDSAALLHYAGDVAIRLGDAAIALGAYRRALALDPTRPTPRVAIARVLRERGDLLAARLELVAALAIAPEWRDALCELAQVHRDAGRLSEARQLLVAHLHRVPTDLDALEVLTDVLVAEERTDDARVAVDRMLRHDPDRAGAWWFDAVLLADQARWRDAVARWQGLASRTESTVWRSRAMEALARAAQLSANQRAS